MFTEKNLEQIKAHNLTEAEVRRQLKIFNAGIPYTNIIDAASPENGIEILSQTEQEGFVNFFENKKDTLDLLKFVPASGAATRMFKFLHQFLEVYSPKDDIDKFLQKEENRNLNLFFESLENFAFTSLVKRELAEKYPNYENLKKGERYYYFVREMLEKSGLNFSNTPKGLVPFHTYGSTYITAFGEQLYEAAFYATSNGEAKLHFTVSEEHRDKFRKRFHEIKSSLEKKTSVRLTVSYSFQKKQTDTIAVTPENRPFLDENGSLVFRPSGHGALLENLNDMEADIIFIKNIDSVVSEKYVGTVAFHKKVLAGRLLSLQEKIFEFAQALRSENISDQLLKSVATFISVELKIKDVVQHKEALLKILERPIRVCGVVENTGAPGGGPFFIKDINGKTSYQIVEMSQIDVHNEHQLSLVKKATHFNPVDLVCGIRNYKGEKYNLLNFSDPDAGFISKKSYHGKFINALELPGLWNGAMANWNTVFVEVPLITFNPVKTVNDLLSEVHQPK